ncbi:MAG: beta-L-arabinofuranosidase domain-containing protein [Bacteroidota bacterium]
MNIKVSVIIFSAILSWSTVNGQAVTNYNNNRYPLRPNPYIELPLGAIQPEGWLREMLVRQKNGSTGNLDKLYPQVMNQRNGWLGGDGDQWERGPYWIDGLLPLAYILKDKELIEKVKPWVEWTIKSQQPNGYFGPSKDYSPEKGVQRNNSADWWPKMVMLKVLKQYYSATGDHRVISLLTNYFKYQLQELPQKPLDHWTTWAKYRSADNLMVVYWLYNITGDKFLLDLADILHKQGFDYTNAFLNTDLLSKTGSIHGVNLAQGIKEPAIYYQQHPQQEYLDAIKKGYGDLRKFNGTANGLYGSDEALHGNNPTQGSELCTAVELMFSLESTLQVTGDLGNADQLEKIAFNTLPAQITADFQYHQYFQQANQINVSRQQYNFDIDHQGTDVCYGFLMGYPCCTSNMHQGWPKFTQNLWYAIPGNGLAAIMYAPSQVTAMVGKGEEVTFKEETNYPFDETIKFTLTTATKAKEMNFPFQLRIPSWCKSGTIKINGQEWKKSEGNQVVTIDRNWKSGDVVELTLPMHVFTNTWYEGSVSIERGPITYALKLDEQQKKIENKKDPEIYGTGYFELSTNSTWNYGLIRQPENKLEEKYKVEKRPGNTNYPWNPDYAPVMITTTAKQVPTWGLYKGMAGPMPYPFNYDQSLLKEETITLVPYGCTRLRISQFPVYRLRK